MWVETKSPWIAIVLFGGRVLPRIWSRVIVVTVVAVITTFMYKEVPLMHFSLTTAPFALIGLPLGIFLGFRNTASYDRFWEGRKLWGSLVNTTRSFARQITTFIEPVDGESASEKEAVVVEQRQLVRMVVGYVHAFRHHLRDQKPPEELSEVLSPSELASIQGQENVPIALLGLIGDRLRLERKRGRIHVLHAPMLEQNLVSLTDIQGACERIKSTPITFSYTVLLHRIVALYCFLLPWGVTDTVGWLAPVVVLFVSYALFGLDAIGEEIEQPFGIDPNDLALFTISRMIEVNLLRRIGATEVPPLAKPQNGILS